MTAAVPPAAPAAPADATVELTCSSCGAEVVIPGHLRTARCLYCDSPAVVDRPVAPGRPDPVFAVGFTVPRAQATARLREWLKRRPLAPRALRRAAPERVQGVYLPAYLYSAVVHSRYRASIGEVYTTTEVTKKGTRTVTKTEVCDLAGGHACYLGDVVVTASRGVGNAELEAVEPFDLAAMQRYAPGLVAGWIAEEPSLDAEASRELARQEARAEVLAMLRRFMPGDHCLGLEHDCRLEHESLDLVLLPLWVFSLRHHPKRPPVRLLVNGQTGAVGGRTPVAWATIGLIAAALAAAAGLIALLVRLL